jgi:hypothetical protein
MDTARCRRVQGCHPLFREHPANRVAVAQDHEVHGHGAEDDGISASAAALTDMPTRDA